jgi:hypothetical protein
VQDSLAVIVHPRLRNLLAFWNAKRGDRMLPARTAIDALDLWEWLGNLLLIESAPEGEFRYRVYGTGLAEYYGRDLTGKTTAALRPEVRAVVRGEYAAVCRSGQPLLVTHTRHVREQPTRVEKLILPFSGDGCTVDRLLAGAYPAADGA